MLVLTIKQVSADRWIGYICYSGTLIYASQGAFDDVSSVLNQQMERMPYVCAVEKGGI